MYDNIKIVEDRLKRFLHDYVSGKSYVKQESVDLAAYEVPGEPVTADFALAQEYLPISVGYKWGKPWSTMWLKVCGSLPSDWPRNERYQAECVFDFNFTDQPGFQAEALAYTNEGKPTKAINPRNTFIPIEDTENFEFYLECAANPNVGDFQYFTKTDLGDPNTIPEIKLYAIKQAQLCLRDKYLWEFEQDFLALYQLMKSLSLDNPRRHEILRCLESCVDQANKSDIAGQVTKLRGILAPVLAQKANASSLKVWAIGHAHIDSAWLWPIRETIRKCARTFSNVCSLMDKYPELKFACSSAQQYEWMRLHYPDIFARVKEYVKQGRFIPVGGQWVEPDGNLPSGESLARQYLLGKEYFINHFGIETKETWLPDSFGYSGNFPQIAKLAGNDSFLTQKVSWNQYNIFPHHTFIWEGIDGSTQFTHFPPADIYNGELTGQELAYFEKNFKEKGYASVGLTPFGYGDGGGGPTREHLAAGKRKADLEGSPKVIFGTVKEFFEVAKAEYSNIPTWVGELYLEMHRGVFSSQLATKQGNRRAEFWLHAAELWASYATLNTDYFYPYERLEKLWQDTLLLQFHDILPGSSIAWVYQDAEKMYRHILQECQNIVQQALDSLIEAKTCSEKTEVRTRYINSAPVEIAQISSCSDGYLEKITDNQHIKVVPNAKGFQLSNEHICALIDQNGDITSLKNLHNGRQALAPEASGGQLWLFADYPNKWDAWDIDEHYRRSGQALTASQSPQILQRQECVAVVSQYTFGSSSVEKIISLKPGEKALDISLKIDWNEEQKMLKIAFPLDLRASVSNAEIQFGHVSRPIEVNTMWDYARFETCMHRWMYFAEGDYGVAIANDSSYGYDVTRQIRADGYTTTLARATVIRGPVYPDPRADKGQYEVNYSLMPQASIADAIAQGYRLNTELIEISGEYKPGIELKPLALSSSGQVIVETIKMAQDRSGDLIVRLYESWGQQAASHLNLAFEATKIVEVDLLERQLEGKDFCAGRQIELRLHPFEVKTLRISK